MIHTSLEVSGKYKKKVLGRNPKGSLTNTTSGVRCWEATEVEGASQSPGGRRPPAQPRSRAHRESVSLSPPLPAHQRRHVPWLPETSCLPLPLFGALLRAPRWYSSWERDASLVTCFLRTNLRGESWDQQSPRVPRLALANALLARGITAQSAETSVYRPQALCCDKFSAVHTTLCGRDHDSNASTLRQKC